MKISERWLREWVNPDVDAKALAHALNLAGLECEARPLLSTLPSQVVVGRITAVEAHPNADRLRICDVDTGEAATRRIVCGAPNAAVGLRAPTALPGAQLFNGMTISDSEVRGVASAGMLCSAAELGLTEKSEGLLELDSGAMPGTPIVDYLKLDDNILDFDLTPNRGDCLSIAGIAREVRAIYDLPDQSPGFRAPVVCVMDGCDVNVDDMQGCPHYVGRVVSGVRASARTPDWMREHLRRSGIRPINVLVDVTNFVMLELGQPMHAFDCAKLEGGIRVRRARAGETLALLNEQTLTLTGEDLVIADSQRAIALAGVMGGEGSGVDSDTTQVFLESACFDPVTVSAAGRRHKLLSDARHRFERGVDPALQRRALDRATALIIELCGGEAGPVTEVGRAPASGAMITLRHARVSRLLGLELSANDVVTLLKRLGIDCLVDTAGVWRARAPTFRRDLAIEADLIEEVGRLYGYDRIPARPAPVALPRYARAETRRPADAMRDVLTARGYREVVTYSFVDPSLQTLLAPDDRPLALDNPIAETMGVMRTTLWAGLLSTWRYNRQRQRPRARLFEVGRCFLGDGDNIDQPLRIAGLLAGSRWPEQWASSDEAADFYDAKADVAALVAPLQLRFEATAHPALHPGRCARIFRDDVACGWIGELHPGRVRDLELESAPLLFELDLGTITELALPCYAALSEQPQMRRDLAFVVREEVAAAALQAAVHEAGGPLLRAVNVFDVYRGVGLDVGCKSVALGLIFQDYSSTLTDEQVDAAVREITSHLGSRLQASVRGG